MATNSTQQKILDEIGDMHSSFVRDAIESVGNSQGSTAGQTVDSSKLDDLAQVLILNSDGTVLYDDVSSALGLVCVVTPQDELAQNPTNTTPVDYSVYVRSNVNESWRLSFSGKAALHGVNVS